MKAKPATGGDLDKDLDDILADPFDTGTKKVETKPANTTIAKPEVKTAKKDDLFGDLGDLVLFR